MPRSATAQAVEEVNALSIDRVVLESTYSKIPVWLVSVIKIVVGRLRDTLKKNTENLITDNIGGLVHLIVLISQEQWETDRWVLSLNLLKEEALYTIGIAGRDTDKILNELIIRELLKVEKDPSGEERVIVEKPNIFHLYF